MDSYKTISAPCEGLYKEKMSKFIAYAFPIQSIKQFEAHLHDIQKQHYDARHICWAYMLGHERTDFRSNDNGEPSGTAGKPILGQINSKRLTNIAILVVRYFGGIKLGTGGLIVAYKEAAANALMAAEIVEQIIKKKLLITVKYEELNRVMKIIKDENLEIIEQTFDNECQISIAIRLNDYERISTRFML